MTLPVLILTRNCLELTKKCVESVKAQDTPTQIFIWDNGSTDGTTEYMREVQPDGRFTWTMGENHGVTYAWNQLLRRVFDVDRSRYALVLNNDAIIPPWFCRQITASEVMYGRCGFVTGVAIDALPTEVAPFCPPDPHPDFSAFLIRRSMWNWMGPFDERMKLYCQDCDYHVRAHRLGVTMYKANVPYYHVNSQTMKRASEEERAEIAEQANRDREVFRGIYGCLPGTKEYEELFK